MATPARCASCSTTCTRPGPTPATCRSTPPTSTTCSSPSPATGRLLRYDHLRCLRLSHDARPQLASPAALPVPDRAHPGHADRVPAAVRVRVRRHAGLRAAYGPEHGPAALTGRAAYANYVAPAIILLTAAAVAQGTAISVASDMTQGIIARFRTMAIARSSVLTGHVLGSLIQSVLGMAVVTGVAVGVGFRPTATPLEWLAAAALLVLVSLAFTWLTVALGLAAQSGETGRNTPMVLVPLSF